MPRAGARSDALRDDLARQARFIFTGTVEQLGAAAMPGVPVDERTAVVRVDAVLRAPDTLGDQVGHTITVQLRGRRGLSAGRRAVFYTNGWLYGDGLAVRAVGQALLREGAGPPASQSAADGGTRADPDLDAHIAGADAVVVGRVTEVRPPVGPEPAAVSVPAGAALPVSEHDPLWQEAVIRVTAAEKGAPAPAGATVTVRFPASVDVRWYRAPKLSPGDEGVFLLHRDVPFEAQHGGAGGAELCVLHPLDLQPADRLDRIRTAIRRVAEENG